MRRKLIAIAIFCLWVGNVFSDVEPSITELKPLYVRTELASDGQARAVIVAPPGEYTELAKSVQAAVFERTGVKLKIIADAKVADRELKLLGDYAKEWNLIAIGNVNSNNRPLCQNIKR